MVEAIRARGRLVEGTRGSTVLHARGIVPPRGAVKRALLARDGFTLRFPQLLTLVLLKITPALL
jgi:hypothetical protein